MHICHGFGVFLTFFSSHFIMFPNHFVNHRRVNFRKKNKEKKSFCKPGTPKELQVNLFLSEAVNTNFMNSKVSLGTVVERSADGTERNVKV